MVERVSDVEEGFSQSAPLVFHYGHTSPAKNLTLYNLLVSRTADVINMKCDESQKGLFTPFSIPSFCIIMIMWKFPLSEEGVLDKY